MRTLCWCGSGLYSHGLYDARGIYVQDVCERCEQKVKERYRPEIFTDPKYSHDEPIDEDED